MPAEGGIGLDPRLGQARVGVKVFFSPTVLLSWGKALTSQSLFNKDGSWVGQCLELSLLVGGGGGGEKPGYQALICHTQPRPPGRGSSAYPHCLKG